MTVREIAPEIAPADELIKACFHWLVSSSIASFPSNYNLSTTHNAWEKLGFIINLQEMVEKRTYQKVGMEKGEDIDGGDVTSFLRLREFAGI